MENLRQLIADEVNASQDAVHFTAAAHTPDIYASMNNPETFVPHHMRDGYQRYFEHNISPGSFGSAILQYDHEGARARADHINREHIATQIEWVKQARAAIAKAGA